MWNCGRRNCCGVGAASRVRAQAKLSGDFQHVMVFFSRNYNASELAAAFESEFTGIPLQRLLDRGGIGPSGMIEKGIVAIAFPREGFRILHRPHRGRWLVRRGTGQLHRALPQDAAFRTGRAKLRDRVFGLMLVDGLSEAEEPLVAAVHWAFDDMQLHRRIVRRRAHVRENCA